MYWLVDSPDIQISQTVQMLEATNFQVRLVTSFEELIVEFNKSRSSIILISDKLDPVDLDHQLIHLTSKPEFSGVRFILTKGKANKDLARLVTTLNFKDIIPLNPNPRKYWLERFQFATTTKDYTKPPPDYQLTIHAIAALRAPARLTWIKENSILIETKLNIPIASKLRIETELPRLSGEKGIQAVVKERRQSNLRYRFSDAYVCEISSEQGKQIINYLKDSEELTLGHKRPIKIFAAIKSAKIRKRLEQILSADLYDLNFALRKNSITTEPSYIKPDLILLDLDIAKLPDDDFIKELSESAGPECKIVFLENEQTNRKSKDLLPKIKQKTQFLEKKLDTIIRYIKKQTENLDINAPEDNIIYLPKTHTLSRLLIRVPARITKLHPDTLSIATPFEIGKFNLALVESPIFTANFDRNIVVKVIGSYENRDPQTREFKFINKALISDLNSQEKVRLSTEILELLENHVFRHYTEESATRKIERAISKTKLLKPKEPLQARSNSDARPSPAILKPPVEPSLGLRSEPSITPKDPGNSPVSKKLYLPRKRKTGNQKQILYSVLFILAFIVGIVILLRQPPEEQGKVFSDSYKRYYEKTKGKKP